MRILFATNHAYLPQRAGGSQSSTHDLAMMLRSMGHTAAVLADIQQGDITWVRNRVISRLTGRSFPPDTLYPYKIYRGYSVENGIREVITNFRPDAVIVQAGRPIPLIRRFLDYGIKTVFYIRDVEFGDLGGDVPQHKNLVAIANSTFTAARFREFSGIEATVITPLVRRESYVTRPRGKYVVFINPVPIKGLAIATALAKQNPDIPFLFVEGWPLSAEHKASLTETLSALPNVRFHPMTNDMRQIYQMAKILLVPSQWEEAWGRVVTEAHFSGIPVLASKIGGLPESVGPGGVLIEPYDSIEAWEQNLRRVWRDNTTYRQLSEAASLFSQRPEIDPRLLTQKLLQAVC